VAALIELEGQILLARNAAWPRGMFGLITGFLEAGETPEHGVAREVLEETGLTAQSTELLGVYDFARKNEVIIGYHVRVQGSIKLNEELTEYRLIAPEKLRPWPFGTGLAMAEWLKRRNIAFEFLDMDTVRATLRGEAKEEV
jgi:NADH pyrophosphatase NudC (nudix superfamily)